MSAFDQTHDPDLSKGLALMQKVAAVFSPPARCGWCGAELTGSAVVDLRSDDDGFCDEICRMDERESYA